MKEIQERMDKIALQRQALDAARDAIADESDAIAAHITEELEKNTKAALDPLIGKPILYVDRLEATVFISSKLVSYSVDDVGDDLLEVNINCVAYNIEYRNSKLATDVFEAEDFMLELQTVGTILDYFNYPLDMTMKARDLVGVDGREMKAKWVDPSNDIYLTELTQEEYKTIKSLIEEAIKAGKKRRQAAYKAVGEWINKFLQEKRNGKEG